jgi:endonuclease/exonuclease/phosphatase family metal-dependent hydrolase
MARFVPRRQDHGVTSDLHDRVAHDETDDEGDFGTLLDGRLRVLTWNLWWRFGPWEQRLPAIVETIRRIDPDVIALQEVWITEDSSSSRVIAETLGFHEVSTHRIELAEGVGFGNAVVSRWPIAGHEVAPLPSPPELDEFRTVLRADIDGPRGPFQVFDTHLHWRLDHSHIRQDQVRTICDLIADSPRRSFPAVLCGDFNALPDTDEVRMLTGRAAAPRPPLVFYDAFEFAGAGDGHTWSNANPYARLDLERSCRIDYVFAGFPKAGGAGHIVDCEVVGADPVDGIVPSDHYGVLATLRY